MERSEQAAREAQLAIFVCDGSRPLNEEDRRAMQAALAAPERLAVINKSDLPQCVHAEELPFETVLTLCAATGEGLDAPIREITRRYGAQARCDGSLLTNPRQYGALKRAQDALARGEASLRGGITPDAVLTDVELAMQALGEVTGRTVREDITDRIFERFCVGK